MAAHPSAFDVWFVAADTVYKGVPYSAVTSWAEQGRIAPTDRLRPAGSTVAWTKAGDHPLVADFLFQGGVAATGTAADSYASLEPVEMDVVARKLADDEDDDVDMIPLIDISLVLLIFFMMTTAVAALSPVDVPDMKNAAELSKDKDAFTVVIDKRPDGSVLYALRVGDTPVAPDDNSLPTPEALIARIGVRLREVQRPPEVRIACHKDLPRERVREVAKELNRLKEKDQIAYFGAEVNEKK
ncbi:MAG: biopolymer transporter ExbD [Gemmataceae bacterium]